MMYLDKLGKKHFCYNMYELLSAQKNDEILAMLENADLSGLVDCYGKTLLHFSAERRNNFIIRHLIGKNVEINAVDRNGNTPFMLLLSHHCIFSVDLDIWGLFIDAGADLCQIKNYKGEDALTLANRYRYSYKKSVEFIESAMKSRFGSSAAIADALIRADYRICDLYIFPDPEVKRHMLVRGCDVNLRNSKFKNNTALHMAAIDNNLDDIKLLLEFGADKNMKNKKKLYPIDVILHSNHDANREAIELLMPDSNEWVDRKCGYSYFEICSVEWLKNFLKPFATTKYQIRFNAFICLMANKNQEVWDVLKNAVYVRDDMPFVNEVHIAILHNRPGALQFLLNTGAKVNLVDREGRSPLFHEATLNLDRVKSMECVEILLRNGANAQWKTYNGDTIVSHLLQLQQFDVLDIILSHLAILEARGSTLDPQILSHIDSSSVAKDSFVKCKQEIDDMIKKTAVYLKLLTCKESKLWKFVHNDDVAQELSKCEGTTYLYRILTARFERGLELDQMRKMARQLIVECVELLDGYELIIEIILDFLDIEDLKLIAN